MKRRLLAGILAVISLGWLMGQTAFTTGSPRMIQSPQWKHGRFRNPQPLWNNFLGALGSMLSANPHRPPRQPLPVASPRLETPPATGLRVTWLGHSTVLLELDGMRILTDPVWGERASPVSWAGPQRFFPPPIPLEDLPRPQVVVISHDHYDHLDRSTLQRMRDWDTRFLVPLGVGSRLRDWGIPADRITELDWWETTRIGVLDITCTPARHASGRGLFDKDKTLWGGFAFQGPGHRVYYSGDTGFFPGLAEIGARLGPFDLTLIEAGAYGQAWPDWHLGPEQAVQAHVLVRGRTLLPVHWGTFKLAAHGWTEPVERVLAAVKNTGIQVLAPRPGESVEPGQPPPPGRWWPDLPWQTAQEVPILATADGLKPLPQN
jgi:L-ascorbate metabolism protein UlaG (beta-lactamase superfamily)